MIVRDLCTSAYREREKMERIEQFERYGDGQPGRGWKYLRSWRLHGVEERIFMFVITALLMYAGLNTAVIRTSPSAEARSPALITATLAVPAASKQVANDTTFQVLTPKDEIAQQASAIVRPEPPKDDPLESLPKERDAFVIHGTDIGRLKRALIDKQIVVSGRLRFDNYRITYAQPSFSLRLECEDGKGAIKFAMESCPQEMQQMLRQHRLPSGASITLIGIVRSFSGDNEVVIDFGSWSSR